MMLRYRILIFLLSMVLLSNASETFINVGYIYIDGNNNEYNVRENDSGAIIQYKPVTPEMSSSGKYSGGEPYTFNITKAEYEETLNLFNALIDDESSQIEDREMGCATIEVVAKGIKYFYIKQNTGGVKKLEAEFEKLKRKYNLVYTLMLAEQYTYADGNGNVYSIGIKQGKAQLQYDPVSMQESSSGMYSGGESYVYEMAVFEFANLTGLFTKAFVATEQHVKNRTKGSGALNQVLEKKHNCILDMNAPLKIAIEHELANLGAKAKIMQMFKTIKGVIAEEFFVAKNGKVTEHKEYYFRPNLVEVNNETIKERYFIKLTGGSVKLDDIKQYVGQEVVVTAMVLKGLWDADDNTQQSRYGDYIIISAIEK